jgi:hypothetical protein
LLPTARKRSAALDSRSGQHALGAVDAVLAFHGGQHLVLEEAQELWAIAAERLRCQGLFGAGRGVVFDSVFVEVGIFAAVRDPDDEEIGDRLVVTEPARQRVEQREIPLPIE